MTSISTTSVSAAPTTAAPTSVAAAHAAYLKTGIDKDAAIGDPDHDGGPKKLSLSAPSGGKVPARGLTSVSSAVTTLNAQSPLGGASSAQASAAYGTGR